MSCRSTCLEKLSQEIASRQIELEWREERLSLRLRQKSTSETEEEQEEDQGHQKRLRPIVEEIKQLQEELKLRKERLKCFREKMYKPDDEGDEWR